MFRYLLILVLLTVSCSDAFAIKIKNPFKRKQKPVIQKMVETKQDWQNEAVSIPLEQRSLKNFSQPKSDKKHYYPDINFGFERYNYPAGSRELNIEDIKKNLVSCPYIVSDINFKYGAYPRYYYSPDNNQISSEIFVEKLDTSKTKVDRILNFHHEQTTRTPVVQSYVKEVYPNLFGGLSIVDWNKSSDKVLIKEKVGSIYGGIYKTYLYVYFVNENRTVKLSNLDEVIQNHILYYQDLQLSKYRYDIKPLGFSAENNDRIIILAHVYSNDGQKVFLGAWEYDCITNRIKLLSDTKSQYNITSSGIIIKRTIE